MSEFNAYGKAIIYYKKEGVWREYEGKIELVPRNGVYCYPDSDTYCIDDMIFHIQRVFTDRWVYIQDTSKKPVRRVKR